MTINLQTGGYIPPQPLPGARGADIQVGQKQVQEDAVISAPKPGYEVPKAASTEEQRYERVAAAAKNFVGNLYPVGDKTFTIYKDATGQYITRYKSLRDGRVTYIPEPQVLAAFDASQRQAKNVISIQA